MDWDFTDSQPQGLAKFVIKDGQVYLGSMDDEHAQIIQEQTGGSWFGISSMGWITPDGHPHPAKGWPRPESDEIEAIRVALGDAKLASFDYAAPHEEPATTPHPSGIPRPNQIGDMSDYYEWVGEVVGQGYIPGSVGKGINTKHGEQIRWTTDSESLGLPTHGEVMNTFNIPALDVLNYLAVDEEGKEEDLTDFGSAWNFGASVNANRLAGNLAGWTMTADLHLPSGNAADNLTEVDEISGGAGWRESADESKAQSEAGEDASAPPFELIGSHLEQIPDHPADPESQHENADQKGPEGISIVHTGSLPEDAAVVELTDGQVIVGEADEHHHEIAQRLKIPNTAVKRMGWVNGVGEIKWYSPLTTDIRTQRPEAWYFESPTLDQVSDERNGHKQVGQVEHDHESLWIIDGEHKHSIAQDWIVPEGLEPWVLGQWGKYIVASDGSRYRWLETEQTHHEVVEAMRERGIPIHDYEAGYLDWEGNEGSYWDLSAMSRTIDAVYNQDADTNTHHHEVNVGDPLWQFHLDPVQARSEGEEDKRPDHNQGYAEQHIERIDFHSGSRDEDGKQTPAQKQANDEPIEVHTDSIPQRPDSIEPVLAIEDDQPGYAPAIWDGQQLYVGYGTTDSVTAQEHNELAEEHGLDDEALARASYGAVDPTGEIHWFMGFDANRGWGFKDAAYEDRWSEKGLIFEDGSIEAWVPGKDNNIFHHFQHPRSKESVAQFSTR